MSIEPIAAMATWIGALSRGGLLLGHVEEEGAELAADVLGEAGLIRLREWFARQTIDVVERERRGAIHACIWMAHADRELASEEIEVLERVIAQSELPPKVQEELVAAIDDPLEAEDIAEELTQPGLRELVLALTLELALSDQRFDASEQAAFDELAEAFGIDEERAEQIRAHVADA